MILQGVLLILAILYPKGTYSTHSCGKQLVFPKIVNSLGFGLEELIESNDSYFFSPLSITVALSMVYIGTRGTTREQMADALDFNTLGKNCLSNKISESVRELVSSLENDGADYSFLMANGGFLQNRFIISQNYASKLLKYFKSNVSYLDFENDEIVTMNAINSWVSNKTKGKVPKLLNEPLDPLTIMVLVNAVYFKGMWHLKFNESNTFNSSFYGVNNSVKTVPFMTFQDRVNYYFDSENNYAFVELDYSGRNVSMIIALPVEKELPQLVLGNPLLCSLRDQFDSMVVTVEIPKFKLEYSRELSKDMIKMGMEELFSDRADLSGITQNKELHVSIMMHKAVIDVNEQGTVAAAISGIGIDGRQGVSQKELFRADHPFLFYIVHKETDTILFSGRVLDP